MAQKKRGLGRGLQALIPEAQAENPSRRPSDVFFPSAAGAETSDGAASTHAATIASTLLAPSKRMQASKRGGQREAQDVSRETSGEAIGVVEQSESVSRETLRAEAGQGRVSDPSDPSAAFESAPAAAGLVPVPGATFADLPVELIAPNPRQPRQVFDEEDIAELAASIKEVGLLQPIVVRRIDGTDGEATRYELIMGERRLRASREAGLETIPAVVRYTEDEDLLRDALLENLHRVQLNPLEEAAAYQQLLEDFSCTHAELSTRIARSRSQISNTLRLMKLPPLVQRRLAAGVLSAGHARALLGLPDAAAMERLAQRIVAEGLSVRATEELVALHDEPVGEVKAPALRSRSIPMPQLSSRLSDVFDTRVKVTQGAKKGKITIEFAGTEDLARIVEALAPGTDPRES
ncbi:ParB/RepB/Spo0J family partition protein [Actinomyces faecalis]|uniref:ParB/RepB/Spo0J family partition protein n=1 Tax=Actinomyces faecalis TaxID=2722820 RepID=UPI0015575E87|nr:ParB/RepB/Spo0J family partition protein [Actinomyces faecalis]